MSAVRHLDVLLAGGAAGGGAALLAAGLLPAQPQLRAALERLAPPRGPRPVPAAAAQGWQARLEEALGRRLARRAGSSLLRLPAAELALLRVAPVRFLGSKALLALVGLGFPPLAGLVLALLGLQLPVLVPAGVSVGLAAGLWLLPDTEVRRRAAAAREEFARAVTAYIDLTALERAAGSGATQALEHAASVGDSWVFVRLREELALARYAGTPPWDRLGELAAELAVPELADVADIMRISGEEGAAVYDTLRARSRGLRAALLSAEQAAANEQSERLVVPVAALGLVFLLLLGVPAVASIL